MSSFLCAGWDLGLGPYRQLRCEEEGVVMRQIRGESYSVREASLRWAQQTGALENRPGIGLFNQAANMLKFEKVQIRVKSLLRAVVFVCLCAIAVRIVLRP